MTFDGHFRDLLTVVTFLCAQLTRDLLAIAQFLVVELQESDEALMTTMTFLVFRRVDDVVR